MPVASLFLSPSLSQSGFAVRVHLDFDLALIVLATFPLSSSGDAGKSLSERGLGRITIHAQSSGKASDSFFTHIQFPSVYPSSHSRLPLNNPLAPHASSFTYQIRHCRINRCLLLLRSSSPSMINMRRNVARIRGLPPLFTEFPHASQSDSRVRPLQPTHSRPERRTDGRTRTDVSEKT